MRSIGGAERALEMMLTRVTDPHRKTFGKQLYEHGKALLATARGRECAVDACNPRHGHRQHCTVAHGYRPLPSLSPQCRPSGGQSESQGRHERYWHSEGSVIWRPMLSYRMFQFVPSGRRSLSGGARSRPRYTGFWRRRRVPGEFKLIDPTTGLLLP